MKYQQPHYQILFVAVVSSIFVALFLVLKKISLSSPNEHIRESLVSFLKKIYP